MAKSVKVNLDVKNLSCANCAIKIENEISQLEGVELVNLNIMSDSLKMVVDESKEKEIIELSQKIADKIEPGTQFLSKNEVTEETGFDFELLKLMVSIVLFIGGIMLKNDFLFIGSYLLSGYEVIFKAIKNLKNGLVFDENFLMTIATLGAFYIGEPLEAAAVMVFYNIGEYLQDKAINQSKKNILDLMNLQEEVTHKIDNGQVIDVSPEFLKVNDILEIRVGEKIVVDGQVVSGQSTLDTKAISGESLPLAIEEGMDVISGSINLSKVFQMKVVKTLDNSTTTKIIQQMKDASDKRSQTEQMITRFSRWYTPIVVMIAVVLAFIFPLIFTNVSRNDWIYRSLVFLVASCPCALVVSVPLSYFSGIGQASRQGILVKSAQVFDDAVKIKHIYTDKTGTITKGNFKVVKVDGNREEVLKIAKSLEMSSNHPIALAIRESDVQHSDVKSLKEVFGQGLIGFIDNHIYFVGNEKLLDTNKIQYTKADPGYTTIYVANEQEHLGTIYLADEIKKDSLEAVLSLQSMGMKVSLLTGDNEQSTKLITDQIPFDEVHSSLLPNDKAEKLKEYSLFVGDGINDGLVLISANIGVAMGALGSDIAIEAADVVIMNDNLKKIPEFLKLSKKVYSIVIQNVILALIIKIGVLILGSLGYADMLMGVFADVGVTLLAVLNALRLFYTSRKDKL